MEKIYTIPVNEAFEQNDNCPFCLLRKKLEDNELDLILGASMMEPDIRIQTNKMGFCDVHYKKMYNLKNRLGLALMLESHLDSVLNATKTDGISLLKDKLSKTGENACEISTSCYVCTRIKTNFDKMMETACLLWENDPESRKKLLNQNHFCLKHYGMFLKFAKLYISKKKQSDFLSAVSSVQTPYAEKVKENISAFCKSFDYRFADIPLEEAKYAVEKAICFLEGDFTEM
ncbi:MAG: hypothetical protein IJO74_04255 [Clostridia bacterium]|nr:hypothetical protein [Clostridia bacterium]